MIILAIDFISRSYNACMPNHMEIPQLHLLTLLSPNINDFYYGCVLMEKISHIFDICIFHFIACESHMIIRSTPCHSSLLDICSQLVV
jgi:hypothetical protein